MTVSQRAGSGKGNLNPMADFIGLSHSPVLTGQKLWVLSKQLMSGKQREWESGQERRSEVTAGGW